MTDVVGDASREAAQHDKVFSALGFLLKALARGAFPAQRLMSRAQFCGAVLRGMEMAPCQHESLPLNMREPISPQGRAQSTLDEGVRG